MQIPFVGFNVVKQAECIISHGVFIGLQCTSLALALTRRLRAAGVRLRPAPQEVLPLAALRDLRLRGGRRDSPRADPSAGVAVSAASLTPSVTRWTGRSLTLLDPTYATKYIPIIASVSEHQPTTWTTFFLDLQIVVPLAPVGIYLLFKEISDGNIFLILYGTVSWYFAGIMIRLMLTLAPIACILAAEGFSGLIRRFMAYLRYAGRDVELGKEKKSGGWERRSCRGPHPRDAGRGERAARRLRESGLLHDPLQLHLVGGVLLAVHRDRYALSLSLSVTRSVLQPRRLADDPRRLPRGVLLDADEHRRER